MTTKAPAFPRGFQPDEPELPKGFREDAPALPKGFEEDSDADYADMRLPIMAGPEPVRIEKKSPQPLSPVGRRLEQALVNRNLIPDKINVGLGQSNLRVTPGLTPNSAMIADEVGMTDDDLYQRARPGQYVRLSDGTVKQRDTTLLEDVLGFGARNVSMAKTSGENYPETLKIDRANKILMSEEAGGFWREGNDGLPFKREWIPVTPEMLAQARREKAEASLAIPFNMMENQLIADAIPKSLDRQAFDAQMSGDGDFLTAAKNILGSPAQAMMSGGESLASMAPSIAVAAISRNPVIAATVADINSGGVEYANGVADYLQRQGIDINNEQAMLSLSPETIEAALNYADTRAFIVGKADAVSGGLASKVVVPQSLVKSTLNREIANIGAQAATDSVVSGAGEAGALAATGQDINFNDVLLEATGAGPQAIAQVLPQAISRAQQLLPQQQEPITNGPTENQEGAGQETGQKPAAETTDANSVPVKEQGSQQVAPPVPEGFVEDGAAQKPEILNAAIEKYGNSAQEAAGAAETPAATKTTEEKDVGSSPLNLSEDEYIRQSNPTGKKTAEDDIIELNEGDLEAPADLTPVRTFTAKSGEEVSISRSPDGAMYAKIGDATVGMVEGDEGETLVNVVKQRQRQGIGSELMAAYLTENPDAKAGSFSPQGEKTRRAAYRKLKVEQSTTTQENKNAPESRFSERPVAASENEVISARADSAPGPSAAERGQSRTVEPNGTNEAVTGQTKNGVRNVYRENQGTDLKGLPKTVTVDGVKHEFHGYKPAQEIAKKYAAKHGSNNPDTYAAVDESRAKKIAKAYEEMKHDPDNPEVKRAYRAMIDETLEQYDDILKTGLKIEFITGEDPYESSPRKAILDVIENNHLWVYPTESGFGSSDTDISGNPLLEKTKHKISGRETTSNDIFRVVHDYFGHVSNGVGFRADGEENAWREHSAMYSPIARRAMTTETRGQNSWVNYGPQGEKNRKASSAETTYADQKTGLLPEWISNGEDAPSDTLAKPEGFVTSVKNEVTDKEREGRGAKFIPKPEVKEDEGTLDAAKKKLEKTPALARELIVKLDTGGIESLTDDDLAVLLVEKTRLMNEQKMLADKASDEKASDASRAVAKADFNAIESQLSDIDNAVKFSGTATARALRFRQLMIRDDFTLAGMERKERVREGRGLTDDERANIRKMADEISRLEKQVQDNAIALAEANERAESEITYDRLLKDLGRQEPKKAAKPIINLQVLKERADKARAALVAMPEINTIKKQGQAGAVVNPSILLHYADIGAFHIANGAETFLQFANRMKNDLGSAFTNLSDALKKKIYDMASGKDVDAPSFSAKKPKKHSVAVNAYHYSSTDGLTSLDPKKAGSADAGGERRRFGMGEFGRRGGTAARVGFYVREDGADIPQPERAVTGKNLYTVRLENLYPIDEDPLDLVSSNIDATEENISDEGFDGFVTKPQAGIEVPVAVVFDIGNKKIPVAKVSEGTESGSETSAQTDSEEFKSWFGDSKVVDENGNPLVVYHGTSKKFRTFDPKKATMGVFWFTTSKEKADAGYDGAEGKGVTMDVYLSLKNPAGWNEYDKFSTGELIGRGYDGLALPYEGETVYVAFNNKQIKLAYKNKPKSTRKLEALKSKMKDRADKARAALEAIPEINSAKKRGQAGAVISPAALLHYADIGAYHIVNGADTLAKFIERMTEDLGAAFTNLEDKAKRAVFGASRARAEKDSAEANKTGPREVKIEKGNLTHKDVYNLARNFVLDGVRGEDALMKAVHDKVKEVMPEVTEREVRQLFSDYGKAQFPSKDVDKRELRDVRALVQIQESIDRINEGLAALKSGPQRDKQSLVVREKRKILNALLKKIIKNSPVYDEEKIQTYMDARANNLRNQIEDLEDQIKTGRRPQKADTPAPNMEVVKLIAERDALREELRAIDGKVKKTKDQIYQQSRSTSMKNRLKLLSERIQKNDYERAPRPEPKKLSKENMELSLQLQKAKEKFIEHQFYSEMAKRGKAMKTVAAIGEALNLSRAVMTSVDLSGVFRQGGILSLSRPGTAVKSLIPMGRAFFSEAYQKKVMDDIADRDVAVGYKRAGLEITDSNAITLSKMEEAFASRWINKSELVEGQTIRNAAKRIKDAPLGLVRGSSRAYSTFLNKLRADVFDTLVATLSENGQATQAEMKEIANYINIATGRGKIGLSGDHSAALNTVFFAPRLVASRFNFLALQPLDPINLRSTSSFKTRKLIAQEYGRFMIGVSTVFALGAMYFAATRDEDDEDTFIETDPRSSDFMKMKFGNTRIDPLAGLSQALVFASRLAVGERVSPEGEPVPLRDDYRPLEMFRNPLERKSVGFGKPDGGSEIGRFLRTKLAPFPGGIVSFFVGKKPDGEEATPANIVKELVVPMSFQSIFDVMREHSVPEGLGITALGLLGMGVQNYSTFDSADEPESKNAFDQLVKDVDSIQKTVETKISALPDDQWDSEIEKLKTEYPEILEGVEIERYADTKQNQNRGVAGQPKKTREGGVKLRYGGTLEDGKSLMGELEGYRYYDIASKREKTSEGILDNVRGVDKVLNEIRKADSLTTDDLVKIANSAPVDFELPDSIGKRSGKIATKQEIGAVVSILTNAKTEQKRAAMKLTNKGNQQ